jgi:sugar/nucleoside kinase (ribokinase family)
MKGFRSEAVHALKKAVGCSILILHLTDRSIAADQQERISRVKHRFIAQPKLQIGGGDNYNAGVCAGLLCGFPISDCMAIGGAVSSYFVEYGVSLNFVQLVEYIKTHHPYQEAL